MARTSKSSGSSLSRWKRYIDDRGDSRSVVLTLPRDKFSNLDAFKNLYVNNIQGTPVLADQIATIAFETWPTAINHFDFTNQLPAEGYSIDEAINMAGETGFLPVVLTSITAICGLLPIVLNPNPLIAPPAVVLIGGLISSTILSRIVTPVMYKLIPPQINSDREF